MPRYSIADIARIVGGELAGRTDVLIEHLTHDSRRIAQPETSLFLALSVGSADGHAYVEDAFNKGVRAFMVSRPMVRDDAAVVIVNDVLQALQRLAAYHRKSFTYPVIGITGSNGKTVVKEWLNTLLEEDYSLIRSPKSYNSQLGVPLSIWGMEATHNLAIIEAGISKVGEMERLAQIIQPTIGVLTNIGEAHDEGFASTDQKLQEKLKLFADAEVVIGTTALLQTLSNKTFTWGEDEEADLQILRIRLQKGSTTIEASYKHQPLQLTIPFTDGASIQNAITCWAVLLHLGLEQPIIAQRFHRLHPIDMRLQLNQGINGCLIINDSYSADPSSLRIALNFLAQQSAGLDRTVVLSELMQSGKPDDVLYAEVAALLQRYQVQKLIAIGEGIEEKLSPHLGANISVNTYSNTEEFIQRFHSSHFNQEAILIKGARRAGFERIAALFEEKLHGTVLQINLAALRHNLKQYQERLKPSTKIMAMVKAFSYGSGGAEIASVLQFNNLAYLGVAYADEGIELVQSGIHLPIMVLNPEPSAFASIVEYRLQPVIYSTTLLHQFETYIKEQGLRNYPVHVEIETGMNRLGFAEAEVETVATHIAANSFLKLQSLFSHLAASEEATNDAFTQQQAERFAAAVARFEQHLGYPFFKHIANSAAIIRHPQLQLDMVRLGIGLYGVEPDAEEVLDLQAVATLRSTVAQLKHVKAGESVSYNRRGVVRRNTLIATVRIGYADGYSRRFGHGVGKMLVRGKAAPVVGTVCMDMTMLDVTDIPDVKEGDDVMVFGAGLPVQEVAGWIDTIPYEIMTSVSQRVKRVYYYE